MHNGFISKDNLKKILDDIQHFLIQHKTPKPEQQPTDKQSIKLNRQQQQRLKQKISHLHAADIAHILEGLLPDDREDVWKQIPAEKRGNILLSVSMPVRETLLKNMPVEEMVEAAGNMDRKEIGDLASLAQTLPDQAVEYILKALTPEQRQQLEEALSYPPGTVGSLMDFSMITAQKDTSVKEVLAYCRELGSLPEHSHHIYVVDKKNTLLGMLPLQTLITLPFDQTISSAMNKSMVSFLPDDKASQATFAFDRYELTAAPIVDENNKLIGRICVDNIVDFMRESSEMHWQPSLYLDYPSPGSGTSHRQQYPTVLCQGSGNQLSNGLI